MNPSPSQNSGKNCITFVMKDDTSTEYPSTAFDYVTQSSYCILQYCSFMCTSKKGINLFWYIKNV